MFFTNLVKEFDVDFGGYIDGADEFVGYCRYFLNELSSYDTIDFPMWVALIGSDEKTMSHIARFIYDEVTTSHDIDVLLECHKHGIEHFYKYQFDHVVDFHYDYSKMDSYIVLKKYIYERAEFPKTMEQIGLKELHSIEPNIFKHLFELNIRNVYNTFQLANVIYKYKRKLKRSMKQILNDLYDTTDNIDVKIICSCILEKTEKITLDTDDSFFVYVKGSFHHMRKILSDADLKWYYNDFIQYEVVDSANMLQFIFDNNNLNLSDGYYLLIMLLNSCVMKPDSIDAKTTYKILTYNEQLSIALFNKVMYSIDMYELDSDGVETKLYNYISNNRKDWVQFAVECKPMSTEIV